MSESEFRDFTRMLFSQLPGLCQWINEHSPDVPATLASWQRTLSVVTLQEAMRVLADWESGAKPPPAVYDREVVALVIRQSVMFDRDRSRRLDTRNASQEALTAEGRRRTYRATALAIPSVLEAYTNGRKIREDFVSGKIGQVEYDQKISGLIAALGVIKGGG